MLDAISPPFDFDGAAFPFVSLFNGNARLEIQATSHIVVRVDERYSTGDNIMDCTDGGRFKREPSSSPSSIIIMLIDLQSITVPESTLR